MLLLDAPDAKSFFSRRIALMPSEAASSSIAEPTTPPPIISKSYSLFLVLMRFDYSSKPFSQKSVITQCLANVLFFHWVFVNFYSPGNMVGKIE